jgi:hypothetical protein
MFLLYGPTRRQEVAESVQVMSERHLHILQDQSGLQGLLRGLLREPANMARDALGLGRQLLCLTQVFPGEPEASAAPRRPVQLRS